MEYPRVQYVSDCFVKPQLPPAESQKPIHLGPWDLTMVNLQYMLKGLLYLKPPDFDSEKQIEPFLMKLNNSLSFALVDFYPLAGRLATLKQENPPSYSIYIDCVNSPGARFVYASLNSMSQDIVVPNHKSDVLNLLFDHSEAINHDGHTSSLLTIQVTELVDSIFIGCSINHMVCDGSSFWHFLSTLSEIFKANGKISELSRIPIHDRFIPEGHGQIISLGPFSHPDQFIRRHELPSKRIKIFHFSSQSLTTLKAKANAECKTTKISTLKALAAHIWRCTTRVQNFPPHQKTSVEIVINSRARMDPPLSQDYFGNCLNSVFPSTTSSELLRNGLGWAAWKLHMAVANYNADQIREWVRLWPCSPTLEQLGAPDGEFRISIGSSPRFNMYGNEFGLGKAIAIRSGETNKFNGKVTLYPGTEGDGSIDLELCLLPHVMFSLECDQEFMESLSL